MSDYQQKALKLSIVPLCLLIGLILCVKINPPWFETLDLAVYTKIDLPNFPQLTTIVRLFAKLATIGPTLCFAFLFAFYIWKKNYHLLAIWNICNIFAVSFFGYILKKLIARIRPAVSQLEIRTSYSFPSGHSLLSFALFLTIILSLSIIWSRQDTRRVAWYFSDLQNVVTDKFYAQLKAGSLTGHETTWQMAVAMAIGKVVAKFQKMKRTATGVAVWVNTLDVYKYLGAADITLQTAFGFKYLTNFLGADVVFVTSEVPQNVVIATPLNNMIAYYVDPGDSEFAKAGLGFTTDSETGFIGFHSEGTYSRMISDNYAIMGLRLFCEYLDAIAYISVGESDTQTLGTLRVTSEAGSEAGTTKLTVKEQLMSMRNCWKYKDAAAATAVTYGMDVKNWSKWDGESEIASTATHHITLVECDQNYKAVRSGDVAATVNPGA